VGSERAWSAYSQRRKSTTTQERIVIRSIVSAVAGAVGVADRDLDVVLFRTVEAIIVAVLLGAAALVLLTPASFGL